MRNEAKKAIRKHIRSLGWSETIQVMAYWSAYIKEYASHMNVVNGLDGMHKQVKKNIDIEVAAYKVECAAKHLQRMARTEQDKWAQAFIDGLAEFGTY
jgi:hypothetical protein